MHRDAVDADAETDADEIVLLRNRLMIGSYVQVLLQILAAVGIFLGIYYPTCTTNEQCEVGSYCTGKTCDFCGGSGKGTPPIQFRTGDGMLMNRGFDPGNRNGALLCNAFAAQAAAVAPFGYFNCSARLFTLLQATWTGCALVIGRAAVQLIILLRLWTVNLTRHEIGLASTT